VNTSLGQNSLKSSSPAAIIGLIGAVRADRSFNTGTVPLKDGRFLMAASKTAVGKKDLVAELKKDRRLRGQVIRMLARDFPGEFLAPVKIKAQETGSKLVGVPISCKEWQE
jgi:hypothetical protein